MPQPTQPTGGEVAAGVGQVAMPQPSTPAVPTNGGMSDADLHEWRRRNAESMKILEATTPELKRKPVAEAGAH